MTNNLNRVHIIVKKILPLKTWCSLQKHTVLPPKISRSYDLHHVIKLQVFLIFISLLNLDSVHARAFEQYEFDLDKTITVCLNCNKLFIKNHKNFLRSLYIPGSSVLYFTTYRKYTCHILLF